MKLFGWMTGREGSRPALSRASTITTIGAWPQTYEAQVREGYLGNAIVQRAIRLVCDGLADAPVTASDPALLALVAARSGGQALLASVAAHLLLHGMRRGRSICRWRRSAARYG